MPDGNAAAEALAGKERFTFYDLVRIMELLRAPGGCPWDREQDHVSLKRYLIEEAYEVLEAIDQKDDAHLCDELGDVLLQVVFHANVSEAFGVDDVCTAVCRKMIKRHPHVFGDAVAETADEVLVNWEQIKQREKGAKDHASILRGVPANLPALMRAYKVQQKARDAGFDWDSAAPVAAKVEEEWAELGEAMRAADADATEDEFGDLLFAAVNLARFAGVHPELSLTRATEKFIRRFEAMERAVAAEGKQLAGMPLVEMDAYWERAKRELARADAEASGSQGEG